MTRSRQSTIGVCGWVYSCEVADYTSIDILKDGEAVCAFEEQSAPGREGAERHGRRYRVRSRPTEFVGKAMDSLRRSAGRACETMV